MFGTQEGLHRGVPMLFVPFFGDQMRNGLKATRAGYARTLLFKDLNKINFLSNITELLQNRSYSENAKIASSLFRDNIVSPLDEAVFWMEYAVRNKGAPHLKSASRYIPWYEYLLLDVFICAALLLFIVLFVIVKIIKFILSIVCDNTKSNIKLKSK